MGERERAAAALGRSASEAAFGVWSPGRINLIGDHIDYSGGLVLPMAIDRGTSAVVFPREDRLLRGHSQNFPDDGVVTADLDSLDFDEDRGWFSYVLGVLWAARDEGMETPTGFDIHLTGDIPEGGGLSSSASVEMAAAVACERMYSPGWDATRWAVIGRRAENEYVGVASGIMDQLAIARGREGMALLMDCSTLQVRYVGFPTDRATVLVANTKSPRRLADSAYNDRRAAVETATRIVAGRVAVAVQGLARMSPGNVEQCRTELEEAGVWTEARHTVTEQARVVAAAEALADGDVAVVGRLMRESHESLRDDFRVTGPHLDALAEAAWLTPGVIGARMTGAGFGGCTVNLVEVGMAEQAAVGISQRYAAATGITPEVFAVSPGAGAHLA